MDDRGDGRWATQANRLRSAQVISVQRSISLHCRSDAADPRVSAASPAVRSAALGPGLTFDNRNRQIEFSKRSTYHDDRVFFRSPEPAALGDAGDLPTS